MALTVNTNMASQRAANSLNNTMGNLSNTLSRISTGLRVTKAADDAAGMAVATNLSTQARSGRQAIRNANDGISVIQTAESASKEVLNILDRMRELSVQSSSETLADGERDYINDEFDDLSNEVQRIAKATEFNDIALADGTTTSLDVQVGVDSGTSSQVTITLGNLSSSTLGVATGDVDLSTASGAQTAIGTIDTAIDSVNSIRADYGSVQNRLDSSIGTMTSYVESLSAASSQIMDADYAHETSEMTRLQVMQQAGVSALAQAKGMNSSVMQLLG
ncbi:MAG TPA: flagellin FliC, partial [Myxococcales bacterium]|nr:flagellin FliC [Myxococcales bacterium]